MTDQPPLPDLLQSDIDASTLRQWITDVGTLTEIIEIIPKHRRGYVEEHAESPQLDEAYQMLVEGRVAGLQIRYLHQGKLWWDTVMPLPEGCFRIVRIEHPLTPA